MKFSNQVPRFRPGLEVNMISDLLSAAILICLIYETYLVHKNLKIQNKMEANDKKIIKELKEKVERQEKVIFVDHKPADAVSTLRVPYDK